MVIVILIILTIIIILNNDGHYNKKKQQKNILPIILIYISHIYFRNFGNVATLIFCVFHYIHNICLFHLLQV